MPSTGAVLEEGANQISPQEAGEKPRLGALSGGRLWGFRVQGAVVFRGSGFRLSGSSLIFFGGGLFGLGFRVWASGSPYTLSFKS